MGRTKTVEKLKKRYYWPNQYKKILYLTLKGLIIMKVMLLHNLLASYVERLRVYYISRKENLKDLLCH